ncbi:MAG: methylenetetrahydrofolate reductase [NAD(P)H] [Eubacteriales bacterium]|nr:methylenetetrahydrofolate reductase [NAD(P)H] [Eubacteriales bacterium]
MKISEIFQTKKTVFSMEVFPPKQSSKIDTIYDTIERLGDTNPDFISVTYGAGGTGTGSLTAKIASDIKNTYHIESIAHLTAIHSTRAQATEVLKEFRDMGIENVLALRGDLHPELPVPGEFQHASDLTQFISDFGGFDICGACYPEGHPESADLTSDIINMRTKIDAGATHLISQLFFDNNDFYAFLERAKLAGINVPIEAGIMPVINKSQIERMVSTCGASLPRKFAHMVSRYENDPEALFDAGIAYAVDQIIDLIASGVDGIHLYTMNNPRVAHIIYTRIKKVLEASNKA